MAKDKGEEKREMESDMDTVVGGEQDPNALIKSVIDNVTAPPPTAEDVAGLQARIEELEGEKTGVLNDLRAERERSRNFRDELQMHETPPEPPPYAPGQPAGPQYGEPTAPQYSLEDPMTVGVFQQAMIPILQQIGLANQAMRKEMGTVRVQSRYADWDDVVEKHAKPDILAQPNGAKLLQGIAPELLYAYGQKVKMAQESAGESPASVGSTRRVRTRAERLAELTEGPTVAPVGGGPRTLELTPELVEQLASISEEKLSPELRELLSGAIPGIRSIG